jgi:hypothetical protein
LPCSNCKTLENCEFCFLTKVQKDKCELVQNRLTQVSTQKLVEELSKRDLVHTSKIQQGQKYALEVIKEDSVTRGEYCGPCTFLIIN